MKEDSNDFYIIDSRSEEINQEIISSIIKKYDDEKNILLFGEVQSGKTNNIINIIKGLFDEDKVDYIFYVTGNTLNLKNQNFERLNKSLTVRNVKVVNASNKFLLSKDNTNLKKNKVVFTMLKQYFKNIVDFINNNLSEKRILIIDDESDDYSTSVENNAIIKDLLEQGAGIISCTATPFTNLALNEKMYDAFYKMVPWEGYSGRNDFDENVVEISDNDAIYFISLMEWTKTIYENQLEDAQLLFNTDNATAAHRYDKAKIIELVEEIIYKPQFHKLKFKELTNDDIDIEKVIVILKKIKSSGGFKALNRKSEDILSNEGYEIVSGGILLSRGITYENLISEVYRNFGETTTAHTLIQRSRWFGYRKDRKPLMRIYLQTKTKEAYKQIDELYELTLKHEINNGISYKDKVRSRSKMWDKIIV